MQRVLRYDGLIPNVFGKDGNWRAVRPEDVREMAEYVQSNRKSSTHFDIVIEGQTPGDEGQKAREIVREWAEAGATWWIETMWEEPGKETSLDAVRTRLNQGPPIL
jgi:hypothetical protein